MGIAATYDSVLPPGHDLDIAERYAPGVTKELVQLAKDVSRRADKEQDHRHGLENREGRNRTIGLIAAIGYLAAVVGLGAAGVDQVAIAMVSAAGLVVGVLVIGRWWHPTRGGEGAGGT